MSEIEINKFSKNVIFNNIKYNDISKPFTMNYDCIYDIFTISGSFKLYLNYKQTNIIFSGDLIFKRNNDVQIDDGSSFNNEPYICSKNNFGNMLEILDVNFDTDIINRLNNLLDI